MIENKTAASNFYSTKAALTAVSKAYKKGIDVSRSKLIEKLGDSTQIDGYIVSTLKIPKA